MDRGTASRSAPSSASRPGDLLDQHRRADAAPTRGPRRVLDGDVVGHEHRLHGDPSASASSASHLEVEHVARVVLDDVEHAGFRADRQGRREHLVGRRRREDLAGACGIQHPKPTKPLCSGSRPDPPPEISATLPCFTAAPREDPCWRSRRRGRGGLQHAREGVGEHRCRCVDELLHARASSSSGASVRVVRSACVREMTTNSGPAAMPPTISAIT